MHNIRRKEQDEFRWWIRHVAERGGSTRDWFEVIDEVAASMPNYPDQLALGDRPCGKLLDVGCGPKVPARQLNHSELWGVDPLLPWYLAAGFRLANYRAVLLPCRAEDMWPIPGDWFDTVVSLNALDHCDNFAQVAAEIERVLKPGGLIRLSVPYHKPTPTEPLALDPATVRAAFSQPMRVIDTREHSGLVEDLWTND